MDMRPQIGPEGRSRPLIVALDHLDAGALPLVGGKAANQGKTHRPIPVPRAQCWLVRATDAECHPGRTPRRRMKAVATHRRSPDVERVVE